MLSICDKSHTKCFVSGEKKAWVNKVNTEYKRKYKIAICMIEEGVLTDYDDVELTDVCYDLKDICMIFIETIIFQ